MAFRQLAKIKSSVLTLGLWLCFGHGLFAQYVVPVSKNSTSLPAYLDLWAIRTQPLPNQEDSPLALSSNPASKAFFCVKERELEKRSGMPIRFRLGDLQTVDRIEGK